MSNTTPNYYTINSTSIFSNAVKYYFGEGSPNATYYLPIGDDTVIENPENDIRVQKYTSSDLYTEPCILSQFCIGGAPIVFIKKGTFPKLGSNSFIWGQKLNKRLTNANYNITAVVFRGEFDEDKKLTAYYIEDYTGKDKAGNNIGYENRTEAPTVDPNPLTDTIKNKANADNFDENTSSDLPSRIGFVIVGGGGGAGGGSYFTDASCTGDSKDKEDAVVPGAGGGGGAIATGVFNFSYPEVCYSWVNYKGENKQIHTIAETYPIFDSNGKVLTSKIENLRVTKIEFHIAGGRGGRGNGGNTTRGGDDEGTKNGEPGTDVIIYVKYNLTSNGTDWYETQQETVRMPHKILTISGGQGGTRGDYSVSEVTAGSGGAAQRIANNPALWQVGAYSGGAGAGVIISSNVGSPGSLEGYSKSFYLTEETPTAAYRLDISHAGAGVAGYANNDNWTGAIYGGHSYGQGGQSNTPPTKGGGGGFVRTNTGHNNSFENRDTTNDGVGEPTDGAHGYFAIYY